MGVVQGTNTPDFLIAREAIFQDLKTKSPLRGSLLFGGEGGIRTLEEVAPLPDFESGRFSRSRTSPWGASI